MCSLFCNYAVIHYDNSIAVFNGIQSMSDYNDSYGSRQSVQHFLNGGLGNRIQMAGCFIKNQDRRVSKQCAGNGKPLLLTAGEGISIFTNR